MIEKLTPEQEDLFVVYEKKWIEIMFSTEPIDREKATEAVKEAYSAVGETEPKIIFCGSLYEGINLVSACKLSTNQLYEELGVNLVKLFEELLFFTTFRYFQKQISTQLVIQLWRNQIMSNINSFFTRQINEILIQNQVALGMEYNKYLNPIALAGVYAFSDFLFFILNSKCNTNHITWQALEFFATQCGWIFPYKKVCIVCDRPRILSLDSQHRLHAEGGPAIQFADGYSIYSYHGVTLPEQYGKIHPNEWESQWILSESNAELKRVLIQGIGCDRITHE